MEFFIQQTAAGLTSGAIYACVALGLVMIYVSTDHINFAQGEMAMFATYIAWMLIDAGVPFWLAFGLTALTQCAVTAARWRQVLGAWPVTEAFPGGGE